MKRLLAQTGLTAFSALAVAFYLSEKLVIVLIAACLAAFVALMLNRKARRRIYPPVMALTAAVALAVNLGYSHLVVSPIQEACSGDDRLVEATLVEEEYVSGSRWFYRLRTDAIDGSPAGADLMLSTLRPIDIEPFDKLTFTADIFPTKNDYNLAKGYYLSVYVYDSEFVVTPGDSRPPMYYAIQLRRALRAAIQEYLPDDVADLCRAVFIGDRYAVSGSDTADFRYAGASYFIVVSGMHFSLFCMLFLYLFRSLQRRYGMNPYIGYSVMLAVVLVYISVTGFQPSVVRSGVMMLVYIVGRFIRRISDSYNSLGVAAFVSMIIFSPFGAGDIGLILSFAATFAIISWQEPIRKKLTVRFKKPHSIAARAVNAVLDVLSVSLAANILVLPISIVFFRGFSTVTLVSALLLILPIELLMILSLFLCLFFYLGPLRYISLVISWPMYICGRAVLLTVRALASLPFSYIRVGTVFADIWVVVSVILGAVLLARRNNYKLLPYTTLLSAAVLAFLAVAEALIGLNTVALRVYDCSGMAVGVDLRGRYSMLSLDADSRSAADILDGLSARYGSAEVAVCSSKRDLRNYSRLSEREFAISHLLMYDTDIRYDGSARLWQADDWSAYLGDDAYLNVRSRGKRLLSYLQAGDWTVLVIPDGWPYRYIPEEFRAADIIVMRRALDGYEGLTCSALIICDSGESAEQSARLMSSSYDTIEYTYNGDITVDLR